MRPRGKQLEFALRTWGGRRAGAGRKPKGKKAGIQHRRREAVSKHHPVHVTTRLRREYRSLRRKQRMQVMRKAFAKAQHRDFRITDWSVQHDHVHLIVETRSSRTLSLGMRSFTGCVAKGLNRLTQRKGQVFADRYHTHILRTPREMRSALAYVLNNARHHGLKLSARATDPCSSGVWFDGWRGRAPQQLRDVESTEYARPQSWLRRVGWRRHGLISVSEIPGCTRKGQT